jgi:hypothetical protein
LRLAGKLLAPKAAAAAAVPGSAAATAAAEGPLEASGRTCPAPPQGAPVLAKGDRRRKKKGGVRVAGKGHGARELRVWC